MRKVLFIPTETTYLLRNEILRPGLPIESVHFDGDLATGTFHLGVFVDDTLACVGSFMLSEFNGMPAYQLRGMATHEKFQQQGLGRLLMEKAEKIVFANDIKSIWCNAREIAVPFYTKLGYHTHGDFFMIEGVGNHVVMAKDL
ncbi:GNAT family N-acetyltransferase [Ornithobacterium rhinotracheale]|uniref:GNAT family N-acetyltransferase n=1 Tax=Ornithobacterium rhinotracheale TaxID=28251 RepID=UPI004035BC4C